MYCRTCGAEIAAEDKYCQKCGSVNEEAYPEMQQELTKEKTKKKYGFIIGGILIGVLVLVLGVFFMKPTIHEVDVATASSMIYSDEMESYYGDEFHIRGILVKDDRDNKNDNYYSLVASLEEMNAEDIDIVVFVYNQEIAEQVGTGSEIIIKGKLNEESGSGTIIVDEIEVLKEESIYYTDMETILADLDFYEGKKIVVTGRLYRELLKVQDWLFDVGGNQGIQVDGNVITDDFIKYLREGSVGIVSGTIVDTPDGKKFKIEKFEQNEQTKTMFENDTNPWLVSGIYQYGRWQDGALEGEKVTVIGTYIENFSYSNPQVIMDFENGQSLKLDSSPLCDYTPYFSNKQTIIVTGTLKRGGTGYILEVEGIG